MEILGVAVLNVAVLNVAVLIGNRYNDIFLYFDLNYSKDFYGEN